MAETISIAEYGLLEHWLSACRNSAGFSACIFPRRRIGTEVSEWRMLPVAIGVVPSASCWQQLVTFKDGLSFRAAHLL